MRQYHWSDLLKTLVNDNLIAFWGGKKKKFNAECFVQCFPTTVFSVSTPAAMCDHQLLPHTEDNPSKSYVTQKSASVEDSYLLGCSALLLLD
jgi:hypothetical protein